QGENRALDRMLQLKREEGDPVNLVLLALGQLHAISAGALFGPAKVWISTTPFLATRFPKTRGTKKDPRELLGPDGQRAFALHILKDEIERLRARRSEMPLPASVEPLNHEHQC